MKKLVLPLLFIFIGCNAHTMKPNQNITEKFPFELEKYLGTWYEIARFDHKFEKGLQGVTATYSIRDDGKVKVLNSGYRNTLDGEYKEAIGKAKTTTENRRLKVSFFWIFYSPYNILELDKDYSYALIGTGSDKYLWILSRTPQMDIETYNLLLKKAKERGYDVSKLIKVKQPTE